MRHGAPSRLGDSLPRPNFGNIVEEQGDFECQLTLSLKRNFKAFSKTVTPEFVAKLRKPPLAEEKPTFHF